MRRTTLLVALLLTLCLPAYAQDASPVRVSPGTVEVGLGYRGADLLIEGRASPGIEVVVRVTGRPATVTLGQKGRVLGLFWTTTEQAVVENVPVFHAVYASRPLETLLDREDQVRIGVDPECAGILSQARVLGEAGGESSLPPERQREYLTGLRDGYLKSERYRPCASCHRTRRSGGADPSRRTEPAPGTITLSGGKWSLPLRLPADLPLGEYDVAAYYLQEGREVHRETTGFRVEKTGMVKALSDMATQNAPGYGVMSLLVVMLTGLSIGIAFPKKRR